MLGALTATSDTAPVLDIFVRKTGNDDQRLRQWINENDIPISLIRSKRITVNHGDAYAGAVPQVWTQRVDGQWIKQ